MKVHLASDRGFTLIENRFIDRYMPQANGEYVKLYLYLLRCAGSGRELSVSSIADFFDHTEKDVRRALSYWEKLHLLRVSYGEDGTISEIAFLGGEDVRADEALPRENTPVEAPAQEAEPAGEETNRAPAKRRMSAARLKAFQEQEQIRQLIFVSSQYLGRPLTSAEVGTLLYFYEDLHFSCDLIEYLVEYCASRGNPGIRYMEKIAQDWYLRSIRTVAEAKADVQQHAGSAAVYREIFRMLGIISRSPAQAEIEYMDRWLQDWGFSMEIIAQACEKTILLTGQPSFIYADSILRSWHKQGVRTLQDIEALDSDHKVRRSTSRAASGRGKEDGRAGRGSSRFSNYPQREYDFDALEGNLLQVQPGNEETS